MSESWRARDLPDKRSQSLTWKKTYAQRSLMGAVDYGPSGTGEPVAAQCGERRPEHRADQSRLPISPWLRDPSALSVGAADADPSGLPVATRDFVAWLARRGR